MPGRGLTALILVLGLVVGVLVLAGGGVVAFVGTRAIASQCSSAAEPVSVSTAAGVPTNLLPIFQGAATQSGLGAEGWAYLAAINDVESTFGESDLQGVHSGANPFGAAGPMQIGIGGAAGNEWPSVMVTNVPSSFTYVGANGAKIEVPGGVSPPSVYNEADAVYAAANYLHRSGAPRDWPSAILAYNHSQQYVSQVEGDAKQYLSSASTGSSAQLVSDVKPATGTPGGSLTTDPGGLVGATIYNSPGDPSAPGAYGGPPLTTDFADGQPPFAELGGRTSAAANLLGGLAPGTPLLISNPANGRSVVAYKRDFGYGQGNATLEGHRYRIDLWWQTAHELGISASALVKVSLTNGASTASGTAVATSSSNAMCGSVDLATGTLGQRLLTYAEQFNGLPYVYAGREPSTGFDCSGLVYYVFKHFGINLPPPTETQVTLGSKLSGPAQLQPGDLIFSQWPGDNASPGHVAIYVGARPGQRGLWTFEASDPALGVRYAPFDVDYRTHVVAYTRVVQLASSGSQNG